MKTTINALSTEGITELIVRFSRPLLSIRSVPATLNKFRQIPRNSMKFHGLSTEVIDT